MLRAVISNGLEEYWRSTSPASTSGPALARRTAHGQYTLGA